jgi:hypothetical protein
LPFLDVLIPESFEFEAAGRRCLARLGHEVPADAVTLLLYLGGQFHRTLMQHGSNSCPRRLLGELEDAQKALLVLGLEAGEVICVGRSAEIHEVDLGKLGRLGGRENHTA